MIRQQAKAHVCMRSILWAVMIAGAARCVSMQAVLGLPKNHQKSAKISMIESEKFRQAVMNYRIAHGKESKKIAISDINDHGSTTKNVSTTSSTSRKSVTSSANIPNAEYANMTNAIIHD